MSKMLQIASCGIRKAFIVGLLLLIQSVLFAQSNVITFEPTETNPTTTLYNLSTSGSQSVNLKDYLSTCATDKNYFDARTISPNADTYSTIEYSCEKGNAILFNETYLSTYTGGSYNGWYDWTISKQNYGWNSSWTTAEIQGIANTGYGKYDLSAAAGLGVDSDAYAVCYLDIYNNTNGYATIDFAEPSDLDSICVTNTTLSLANCVGGSSFSSAFSEGDYFTLTIKGFTLDDNNNHIYDPNMTTDVDLVRFHDGYLTFLDAWKELDLSSYTDVDGLDFSLSTSDVGAYGPNTPYYFAIDNLSFATSLPPVPPSPETDVPEPATWILLTLGFILIYFRKRR